MWSRTAVIAVAVWALFGFVGGFYGSPETDVSGWAVLLGGVALFVAVTFWFFSDRVHHRQVGDQYGGFGFFVFWPLLLPIYLVQTRGWRRTLRTLATLALLWLAAAILGLVLRSLLT